jgi:hypothetical protein
MGEEYGDSAQVDEGMFRYRFWYCNDDVEDIEDDLDIDDIDTAHLDLPDALDSSSTSPYIRSWIAFVIFWKSIVKTSAHCSLSISEDRRKYSSELLKRS